MDATERHEVLRRRFFGDSRNYFARSLEILNEYLSIAAILTYLVDVRTVCGRTTFTSSRVLTFLVSWIIRSHRPGIQ